MKISLFNNGYIAIWEDHSYTPPETINGITTPSIGHPDCILCEEVDFNPDTQTIRYDGNFIVEDIPVREKTDIEKKQDIWVAITQEVYGWNPYAQIADLAKAQVTTLAILVQILGKEVVSTAYADLIVTVKKVSEARVKEGLSPYDLSFLE